MHVFPRILAPVSIVLGFCAYFVDISAQVGMGLHHYTKFDGRQFELSNPDVVAKNNRCHCSKLYRRIAGGALLACGIAMLIDAVSCTDFISICCTAVYYTSTWWALIPAVGSCAVIIAIPLTVCAFGLKYLA